MIPTASAVSSNLTWTRLPRYRGYELRQNGKILGTLQRPGFWSSQCVATTTEGNWTLRRSGIWGGAEIVDSSSRQHIASFEPAWNGGGLLRFADGQTFRFALKGLCRPVWTVTTETGEPLLSLRRREHTADLFSGSSVSQSRLTVLLMFTLYRMRQAEEDDASAALIAVIS